MTRKILFLMFFCALSAHSLSAQFHCKEGDCTDGYGKGVYTLNQQELGHYEGFFKNGKFSGKGKFVYPKGDYYEGEWMENMPNGYGIRYHVDGKVESGKWDKNKLVEAIETEKVLAIIKPENKVELASGNKCEQGDCRNGYGQSVDAKGNRYTGDFQKNVYHGYGEMKFANGDNYKGHWANGLQNGKGSLYRRNGHTETGEWAEGKFQGNPITMWALVVGVGDYQNFQKLNFTTTDAQKVYNFLRSPEGGFLPDNQIKKLFDKDATAFNIQNTMAELFEQADTNDIILFYFAGHGIEGAFLPVDYAKDGSNQLYHTSINNLMMDSPAKYKLILADACHSGSFAVTYNDYKNNNYQLPPTATRSEKSTREKIKEFYKSYQNVKGGLAIIMSSASEEISLEASKLGQGVFSYYVIEGLKGEADTDKNNIITVTELFTHISKKVDKFTYGFQTPNISGEYDNAMPVGRVNKPNKSDDEDR